MLCRWIPKAHAHAHAHYFLRLSITGIPLSIFGDWSWIMATIATLMTICWAYSQLHLLLIFLKNHLRMVLFETIKKLLVCINTYICQLKGQHWSKTTIFAVVSAPHACWLTSLRHSISWGVQPIYQWNYQHFRSMASAQKKDTPESDSWSL